MQPLNTIRRILVDFGIDPETTGIEDKGSNGGFSGSHIWKLCVNDPSKSDCSQQYCLKGLPATRHNAESSSQQYQLSLVDQLLSHALENGFDECSLPIAKRTLKNQPWAVHRGRVFELQPWLVGSASYWSQPSHEKLRSACRVLAKFHLATSNLKHETTSPPGINRRIDLIDQFNSGIRSQIESRLRDEHPLGPLATNVLHNYDRLHAILRETLRKLSTQRFEIQFCIRDIWHDHVFFQNENVSGIVDFGAVSHDNVATDLSRLLGSLIGNNQPKWEIALNEYSLIRELSEAERQLIIAYDQSTTVLAGMNWLKWILVENRYFESIEPIRQRIQRLLTRLADW